MRCENERRALAKMLRGVPAWVPIKPTPTWPWLILFPGLAVPGALLCLYWWLS